MNWFIRMVKANLICLVMTGCATIPVTSIYKLRNFDLAKTDVAKLRVAVQTPQFIMIRPTGVKMVIVARGPNNSFNQQEVFVLDELRENDIPIEGRPRPAKWARVSAYRLKPADIKRITAFREQISQLKQVHGEDIKGSISIDVDSCGRSLIPDGPVLITTWIRSEETTEYVVLARNLDLRREAEKTGHILDIKPCSN